MAESELTPDSLPPDEGQEIHRIRIVALLTDDADRHLLAGLAAKMRWSVEFAGTLGEARGLLQQRKTPIVLYDRDLPATNWREAMHLLSSTPTPVYTILLSRVADDYLWAEVMRRGGHDLISTPLRMEDTVRAIRLAWSFWSNSMRVPPMVVKHGR
ncbi:MAG: hypothetical protein ABL967_06795 [Bryobacteraceae bacterium]